MHLAIVSQSAMLLLPRFELADVMKQIKKHKPTIFLRGTGSVQHHQSLPRDLQLGCGFHSALHQRGSCPAG